MEEDLEPSKAQQLASLLSGNASSGYRGATVQRSHRFSTHHFILIENMAKLANCSVSAMINQVIDVGVDALYEHLPQELVKQIHSVSPEQMNKSNSSVSQSVGKKIVKK